MEAHQGDQRPTRREAQKEETRRVILESAYVLFQQLGYDRTTMRELASHSRVGLGTLFKYFPDKPSLLVATFQDDIRTVIAEAFKTLPKKNIHRQLRHILSRVYGFYAKNQAFSRVLVKEALFITGPAGEIIHGQTLEFLKSVGALLQGAVQRQEIALIGNTMEATVGFWSFYLLGLTVGLRDQEFDVETQVKMVSSLLQIHFPPLAG